MDTIYTYFDELTHALAFAQDRPQPYKDAAAMLVIECERIFTTQTAPHKFGGKRWHAVNEGSVLHDLLTTAQNQPCDETWSYRLNQLCQVGINLSTQQQYDALRLVLDNAVERTGETTFVVHSSKPYPVSLPHGDDLLAGGFECRCKGFWSHGGGNVCKHIAAACVELFAPTPTMA